MQWRGLILIIAGVLLGIAGGVFLAKVVCFAPKKALLPLSADFLKKMLQWGWGRVNYRFEIALSQGVAI